jgi:hypothetical protein
MNPTQKAAFDKIVIQVESQLFNVFFLHVCKGQKVVAKARSEEIAATMGRGWSFPITLAEVTEWHAIHIKTAIPTPLRLSLTSPSCRIAQSPDSLFELLRAAGLTNSEARRWH